jgi:hypothetical protein
MNREQSSGGVAFVLGVSPRDSPNSLVSGIGFNFAMDWSFVWKATRRHGRTGSRNVVYLCQMDGSYFKCSRRLGNCISSVMLLGDIT